MICTTGRATTCASNYKGDPDPPLPSVEAAWADQLLRQKGLQRRTKSYT